jgi:tetratricopeptide (TPR) repeat protein
MLRFTRSSLSAITFFVLLGTARANPSDDSPEECLNRGNAALNKNDFENAIKEYTEAIRVKTDYAIAFGNRGLAYSRKKEFEAAIKDLTEAIRLDSNFGDAYLTRAYVHLRNSNSEAAIDDCDTAIRLNSKLTLAFLYRGEA